MLIKIVERNNGMMPSIWISVTKCEVSHRIKADIMKLNRPKEIMISGKDIIFKIGLRKKFAKPSMSPAIKSVFKSPPKLNPGIKSVAR